MKTTTIEIYLTDHPWWRNNCKLKNKASKDCFREFKEKVNLKKQAEFYNTLSKPSNYRHPLLGKRIDKSKLASKL